MPVTDDVDMSWAAFDQSRGLHPRQKAAPPPAGPNPFGAIPLSPEAAAQLKIIQKEAGLPQTGKLDPRIVAYINKTYQTNMSKSGSGGGKGKKAGKPKKNNAAAKAAAARKKQIAAAKAKAAQQKAVQKAVQAALAKQRAAQVKAAAAQAKSGKAAVTPTSTQSQVVTKVGRPTVKLKTKSGSGIVGTSAGQGVKATPTGSLKGRR